MATMTWDEVWADPRHWVPDLVAGVAVLLFGILEAANTDSFSNPWLDLVVWVVLPTAVAVGLSRRLPGVALALVWLTCAMQVVYTTPILYVQLSVAVVSFGTARWGQPLTVVLSALSIPLAGVVALTYATSDLFGIVVNVAQYRRVIDAVHTLGGTWQVGSVVLGMGLLGIPWLAGLTLRFSRRAAESQATASAAQEEAERAQLESGQAREIARLREEQARLARDVHDVVGHSLAVILAQAEAAQYRPDDPTALKETMATIATSARGSLQDVRQVLSTTQAPAQPRDGGLDALIDGIRRSGHDVDSSEVGTRQPLPPELEVVAYRVLQEMLTNAIRHGRRDQPVRVERHWADSHLGEVGDLRIEVRNLVGSPDDTADIPAGSQQGLTGMRRRLEAVGGRLDVRRREETDGVSFTTTAWIPVRPR
jgi:signal transduction histidine kinase